MKIGLSNAQREPHFLTLKNYIVLVKQIWQNDWHEYNHEGYRADFSCKMNLFCFSSARIGELCESSARAGTGAGLRYGVSCPLQTSALSRRG